MQCQQRMPWPIPPLKRLKNIATLFAIESTKDSTKPLNVTMTLNNKEVPMEIDTGSSVTIFPESAYRTISTEPLQESSCSKTLYLLRREIRREGQCDLHSRVWWYRDLRITSNCSSREWASLTWP